MKIYLRGTRFAALLLVLIGCQGFDKTMLLTHPGTTNISETFDAVAINAYLYLDTASAIPKNIKRDSLHLLVGLPDGWEVKEAGMSVVKDMEIGRILSLMQSSSADKEALEQLVMQYIQKAETLRADDVLAAKISGKTITAHSRDFKNKISVNIDNVKQWKGFSAPLNIMLEKGSRFDTSVSVDTVIAFASAVGFMEDSLISAINQIKQDPILGRIFPDTVGIRIVPVLIFLKIKAPDRECADTLYYFTKTDSLNPPPFSAGAFLDEYLGNISGIDAGDMVFTPITVTASAQINRIRQKSEDSDIRIVFDRVDQTVRIGTGSINYGNASITVYSLSGKFVKRLTSGSAANSLIWNCVDEGGRRLESGIYLLNIRIDGENFIRSINLVK